MKTIPASLKVTRKILVLLLFVLLFAPIRETVCGELSGSLQQISMSSNNEKISVLVFFEEDFEAGFSKAAVNPNLGRTKLHEVTYNGLKANSKYYHDKFEMTINQADLEIKVIKKFWITGAALIEINSYDLEALSNLEGVEYIAQDATLSLVDPVEEIPSISLSASAGDNLRAIKADKLWARGLTGKGRLLGSIDTGVEGDHPALANNWQGNLINNPAAGWFDPYGSTFPNDNLGHGTHVMGIMVGLEDDDTIGVAFNAGWMSAAVIDRGSGLSKTISDILAAFEWIADPDGNPATVSDVPDAINHSWGIPEVLFPDCDNTFWTAIDNLETLGIVSIFSAGNEGPDSMSLRHPADRASGPLNAFAVGAVNHADPYYTIASFSSRGPSRCDNSEIKPEIVAPGVLIRSSDLGGGYKLMSGTSMAAPHLTAAVALFREYNPEVTSEQIKQAFIMSAMDLGDEGEDNLYGNGMVDLEAALAFIPPPDAPQISVSGFDIDDGNNNIITADEEFDLVIEIVSQYTSASNLWAKISIPENYAEIIRDSVFYGYVEADSSAINTDNPFRIRLNSQIIPGSRMPVDIDFHDAQGQYMLTKRVYIIVEQSNTAGFYTLSNSEIEMTVDNFGGIGHGPNSLTPSLAPGFIPFDGEFDILPEFSLLIATDEYGIVSDAARTSSGFISDNDFMASREHEFEIQIPGIYGSVDLYGRYNDSLASNPLGLSISQRTSLFDQSDLQNSVIIEYTIERDYTGFDDNLYVGFLSDFDLGAGSTGLEKTAYDYENDFSYYYNQDSDLFVGIRFLNQATYSNQIMYNTPTDKAALTEQDKYDYLVSGIVSDSVNKWGDYFSLISTKTSITSSESTIIAVAIGIGHSLDELSLNMIKAFDHYNLATDIADTNDDLAIPVSFELSQNYPNPFNMATTISFSVKESGHVKLEVFNLLGQKVADLADATYPAGTVRIDWDGKNKSGQDLASGAYFYRMNFNGEQSISRKLMILK